MKLEKKANRILQESRQYSDNGFACLVSLAKFNNINVSKLLIDESSIISLADMVENASYFGLKAEGYKVSTKFLMEYDNPCLLHVVDPSNLQYTYVIFYQYQNEEFHILNPGLNSLITWDRNWLSQIWISRISLLVEVIN